MSRFSVAVVAVVMMLNRKRLSGDMDNGIFCLMINFGSNVKDSAVLKNFKCHNLPSQYISTYSLRLVRWKRSWLASVMLINWIDNVTIMWGITFLCCKRCIIMGAELQTIFVKFRKAEAKSEPFWGIEIVLWLPIYVVPDWIWTDYYSLVSQKNSFPRGVWCKICFPCHLLQ